MLKEKILIVSDWKAATDSVVSLFSKDEVTTQIVALANFKGELKKSIPDLIIFCFPKDQIIHEGGKVLEAREAADSVPLIVVSDNHDWEPAVDAMKFGAQEYFCHPFIKEKFKRAAFHWLKLYRITKKVFALNETNTFASPFEGMVGISERMQENFRMITAVAKSNATVLITGESGTGKELVAKAVHHRSGRGQYRFVDLNCGAIPRDLLENELFGHEKGAFTGAHKRYQGSFEVANRGTLFLDEISEMDPLLQVKLLRVLQERSFMRIGGTEKIDVDVRIIAATNRNLQDSIEKGFFREDLFYRLNVVNINIPSLRERREDIPLLAHHFLEYYSAKNNRIFIDFASDAIEALINYDWPGNVRELENTIERVVVLHNDSQVKLKFLSKQLQKVNRSISFSEVSAPSGEEAKVTPLEDLEKHAIEMALMKYHGNISIVAKKLKIGQATLYRKVKKYGFTQWSKLSGGLS